MVKKNKISIDQIQIIFNIGVGVNDPSDEKINNLLHIEDANKYISAGPCNDALLLFKKNKLENITEEWISDRSRQINLILNQ